MLKLFEDSWSLAKEYLEDPTTLRHLNWFSQLLQDKQDEHRDFKEQIECSDPAIFMSIPSLLVYIAALESKEAIAKQVCERFMPQMVQSTCFKLVEMDLNESTEKKQIEKVVLEIENQAEAVSSNGKSIG